MRTLVVSERLSRGQDDGIKNIAMAFIRELREQGHEVLGLSEWEAQEQEGIRAFRSNRFYLDASLAKAVRGFRPDWIVYVPWTSATARSLFRLRVLRAYTDRASTFLVATQPMPLRGISRRLATRLRPDLIFVQCEETRKILRSVGIETAFLPSGHDAARFSPSSSQERTSLKAELGCSPDAPLVVHVGHLKRERIDPDLMETLLRSVNGLQILVVGSPHTPQDDELAARLQGLGVHLIREYLPDISKVYRAADAYLFPVQNRLACVGVPLSVIEAMACDLPVVSSSFGGLTALFGGHPGVHFASDGAEMADLLARAVRQDAPGTRSEVEDFTWDRIIREAAERMKAATTPPLERARLALSLLEADPAPAPGDVELPEPETLRKYLKNNKIPLLALSRERAQAAGLGPALSGADELREHARNDYHACRHALEGRDIPTVFRKSAGPFPYESDNMDLLVDPARLSEAKATIEKLGYIEMKQYREDFKAIHKLFDGPHLRNIVHFHEEVSWGVEPFLGREALWRRCRPSPDEPDIHVLSREDAFLTVTAHAVYENDRIKLGDLWKIRHLLDAPNFDWDYCRSTARGLGWEPGYDLILLLFHECERRLWGTPRISDDRRVEAEQRLHGLPGLLARGLVRRVSQFPLELSRTGTKALFYRKILTNPTVSTWARLGRFWGATRDNVQALLGINHQRPFLISFSGIDGSGKSTLVNALSTALTHAEIRHRVAWVRGGNSALLQSANRVFRRLLGGRMQHVVARRSPEGGQEQVIVSSLFRWLWPWIVATEQTFLFLLRVRLPMAFRRVIILDRSLYDTLVDLQIRCDDPSIASRLPIAVLAWLAPKPAVAWFLQVDPEVAHRRKKDDFSPETLSRRASCYADVAKQQGLRTVRTDDDVRTTVREVIDTTLKRYADSYPRR